MLISTMLSNRKDTPSHKLPNGDRLLYSFTCDGGTLVSHLPKCWKAIVLLSMQHRDWVS